MKFIGNFKLRLIINLDAVMGIRVSLMTLRSGGGREIRTLGRLLTYAGFQDRCIKPLCHPSALAGILKRPPAFVKCKVSQFYLFAEIFSNKLLFSAVFLLRPVSVALKTKNHRLRWFLRISGGGREIRTLGRLLTYAGFQDRCIKPLCHPSSDAYINQLIAEKKAKP